MGEDYYKLLELEKGASEDDVIKAWKRLSKVYHPDKNPDKKEWADEMQKKINEAKNVLTDPQKRQIYDSYGEEALKNGGGATRGQQFNFEDILGGFFGGKTNFGNIFQNFGFGNPGNKKANPQKIINISLTLEQVFEGYKGTKKMKVNTECQSCEGLGKRDVARCSGCEGRGFKVTIQQFAPGMMAQSRNTCNDCKGKCKIGSGDNCSICEGKTTIDKIIHVDFEFPSGVENDYMIQRTVDDIDFIFVAKVENHPVYKRIGNNLEITKIINLYESLMGVKFNLKLLNGKEITIKSKTVIKPNTEYVLKGLGINGKDLHINFTIIFPDKVISSGKKILSEILGMESENVNDEKEEVVYL